MVRRGAGGTRAGCGGGDGAVICAECVLLDLVIVEVSVRGTCTDGTRVLAMDAACHTCAGSCCSLGTSDPHSRQDKPTRARRPPGSSSRAQFLSACVATAIAAALLAIAAGDLGASDDDGGGGGGGGGFRFLPSADEITLAAGVVLVYANQYTNAVNQTVRPVASVMCVRAI